VQLESDAAQLLLAIAETPEATIAAHALNEFLAEAGRKLIAAGALKPDGFEAVAINADHDDSIVSLFWSAEHGGYAYFSASDGVVRVDDDAIARYRLDLAWLLRWLAGQLGHNASTAPVLLVADRLWRLGDMWLGERKRSRRKTEVFFARRLSDVETLGQVRQALEFRAGQPARVILTTTERPGLSSTVAVSGLATLSLKDCARSSAGAFMIDPAAVYASVHDVVQPRERPPVQVDAEFRVVRVGRREFKFRGDKQRQVIGFLHRRRDERDERVSTALMFAELEFHGATRLRDLFKGHSDWRDLIGQEDGACWLRYDELLAEQGITSD
jgi:hypothetical protein